MEPCSCAAWRVERLEDRPHAGDPAHPRGAARHADAESLIETATEALQVSRSAIESGIYPTDEPFPGHFHTSEFSCSGLCLALITATLALLQSTAPEEGS